MNLLTRRLNVEIRIMSTGEKKYFRCRTGKRHEAIKEVLPYIRALESHYEEPVLWCFTDQKDVVYCSSKVKVEQQPSLMYRVLDYFGLVPY